MLSKQINFLKTDIWRIRLKNYPPKKSFLLRQLRIFVLAVRGFIEDQCKFRASALTFYTLLSIVPVIAMMFGIAKGFGLQDRLTKELMDKMQVDKIQWQQEVAQRIINFANSLLESANGGLIAGIGIVFLLWAVISVLSNIENSFNDIWGVKSPRSIGRRFSDYISMVLVCPFLLIISSSATVVISSQVNTLLEKYTIFNSVGPLILFLLKFLPYCTVWLLFTFICIFLPNTKVKFKSGLFAGIIAGTIFQLVQWGYFNFQIGVIRNNTIYGSFAALPLFLIWLQLSWLAVLFGAELSFAHQNVETYEFEQECLSASNSFKKLLSLQITQLLVKNFCNGKPPCDAETISRTFDIPIRLVRQILFELAGAKILSEAKNDNKEPMYQPAIDVDKLTVKYVVEALEQRGISDIPVEKTTELDKLSNCLSEFSAAIEKSPANILLRDI